MTGQQLRPDRCVVFMRVGDKILGWDVTEPIAGWRMTGLTDRGETEAEVTVRGRFKRRQESPDSWALEERLAAQRLHGRRELGR